MSTGNFFLILLSPLEDKQELQELQCNDNQLLVCDSDGKQTTGAGQPKGTHPLIPTAELQARGLVFITSGNWATDTRSQILYVIPNFKIWSLIYAFYHVVNQEYADLKNNNNNTARVYKRMCAHTDTPGWNGCSGLL